LTSQADAEVINRIYAARGMVPVPAEFFWSKRDARSICYFVAEDEVTGDVLGTVTGVDHHRAFNDPERGSSLWCLAVDPQTRQPGVGEALVRRLIEYFAARGASYLDLSVLHDNEQAIALYEKLGFERVPFFSVKRKNPINETLFTGPEIDPALNPYAKIIVREARRRGIQVEVTDAEGGFFRLTHGGRSIHCRESLSDLTSAVAMSICDDKAVTRRVVRAAGVRVPDQISSTQSTDEIEAFLNRYGKVVVKPARGEQGRGIAVGLSEMEELTAAIFEARKVSDVVLLEEFVEARTCASSSSISAWSRRPSGARHSWSVTASTRSASLSRSRAGAGRQARAANRRSPSMPRRSVPSASPGMVTTPSWPWMRNCGSAGPPICTPAARSMTSPGWCTRAWSRRESSRPGPSTSRLSVSILW
jgi:GNAT-family acetyltransferase (TIGR03103 family)